MRGLQCSLCSLAWIQGLVPWRWTYNIWIGKSPSNSSTTIWLEYKYADIWAALREKIPNVLSRVFFLQVGVIPKEGWTGYPSILILVLQRLRTLGTFSRYAAHICLQKRSMMKTQILECRHEMMSWLWRHEEPRLELRPLQASLSLKPQLLDMKHPDLLTAPEELQGIHNCFQNSFMEWQILDSFMLSGLLLLGEGIVPLRKWKAGPGNGSSNKTTSITKHLLISTQ